MSIAIKNKFTVAALTIATILGMGYSTLASAADANFTAQLTVVSPNVCEPELTPPADPTWNTTWKLDKADDASGVIDTTNFQAEPLEIKVALKTDGGACDLNGMVVGATVTGADVTAVNGQEGYYQVDTKAGGFWRYVPTLAKATFYSDANWATPDTGAVTASTGGAPITQATMPKYTGNAPLTGKAGFGTASAIGVSNNYFATDALLPLTAAKDVVVKTATITPMKSAIIGVSAVIANDPVNGAGTADTALVVNEATITMPFTVEVGYR